MISNAETYDINRDGIADLGLHHDLDERLRAALDHEDRSIQHAVTDEIDRAITAKIQQYGVTDSGEWLGDWSPTDIVTEILDRHGA
jgi:hypothetical protein